MAEVDELPMIADGEEFALSGAADGTAFVLRYKTDGVVTRLEGEDAARFSGEYDGLKAQYPGWSSDQVLAQLWDQGGYSWLATQEG